TPRGRPWATVAAPAATGSRGKTGAMTDTLRAASGHRPRPAWSAATRRLRQLGWSAVLLALTVPALVLFSTTLTGVPLLVVGVGVPLVLGGAWLTRHLADLHRRSSARRSVWRSPGRTGRGPERSRGPSGRPPAPAGCGAS